MAALNWLGGQEKESFNEIFNVGTGAATSVLQAIAAFEEASGTRLRYQIGPRRPGDVVESYASVDKARERLGWRAELSILDAMRDAWKWQVALQKDPL